jgi:NAD(P)-dependent dehydrogenase (short-subunit alcohol dehydrogenase family)
LKKFDTSNDLSNQKRLAMPTENSSQKNSGKVVVVTGASSGAGLAIALAFARTGARLVLAARREQPLAEVVDQCEQAGGSALAVPTDVSDAAAVQALAEAALNFGGRIDVWVNNAGVLAAGLFEETPVSVHDQVIRTNLMGYLHGAHAVLPYFKDQGYGVLINNISVGGYTPAPYAAGYTASKFGLRGLSQSIKGELYKWPNIHVCDVYPAFLDTPGMQHAANYTGHYIKPAPPVYDPQRVARAVVALADHPQETITVGGAAIFLRLAALFAPRLSRRIAATMVDGYLKKAEPLPYTPGNVLLPVEYGTSIHGGWNSQADTAQRRKKALLIGGFVAGLLLLRRL